MADYHYSQSAPYPTQLETLVNGLIYKPGWHLSLRQIDRGQGCQGLTLIVHIVQPDTYHPEKIIRVNHYFPVPPAAYDYRSWRRWLLEQILLVERHETLEFFQIDGVRPYAPHHGPGNDPYIIIDHGSDEEMRTSYLGVTRPGYDPDTE
jgi:hypothetical protein